MNGDSSEPAQSIAKALGVRPDLRVWVGGHHDQAKRSIQAYLAGTIRPTEGPIDLGIVVPETADEWVYFVGKLLARLVPDGGIWVIHVGSDGCGGVSRPSWVQQLPATAGALGLTPLDPVVLPEGFVVARFRLGDPR